MKKIWLVLLLVALGALLPTASQAIIFFCSDCDCTRPCGLFCTDDSSGNRLTCGSTGYCTNGSECLSASFVPAGTAPASPASSTSSTSQASLTSFLQSLAPSPAGASR